MPLMPRKARGALGALGLLLSAAGCAAGFGYGGERIAGWRDQPDVTGSYLAPEGPGPHPAVVLMHGCGGLEGAVPESLGRHAAFLRDNGFASLIVDSLGPRGKSGRMVCSSLDELAAARYYRLGDAFAAAAHLAAKPEVDGENVFLIGQSNGGSVALTAARHGRNRRSDGTPVFAGTVAYYPWCGVMGLSNLSPVLVLHAENDDWVSPRDCVSKSERLDRSAAPVDVVVYPGVHHSFDVDVPRMTFTGRIIEGNAAATSRSRRRYLAFLRRHLR